MLSKFHIVCFLKCWAVNRDNPSLWHLDDQWLLPAQVQVVISCSSGSVGAQFEALLFQ